MLLQQRAKELIDASKLASICGASSIDPRKKLHRGSIIGNAVNKNSVLKKK
jgi:hypothetical protein